MFYLKLFKAIKQNWSRLKYYVLFATVLIGFYYLMSFLKVNSIITYSIIGVTVIVAICISVHRSKSVVETRKESAELKELIGKNGVVLEEVNSKGGRITVDGDEFKAKSKDGSLLTLYSPVDVVDVEDIELIVAAHVKSIEK